MVDFVSTPKAPLTLGNEQEHRRQIAQRANQTLPKNGSEPMTGDLDMGGNAIVNLPGWITPTFDAGNFTASGSMVWTVEAGDVATYAYKYLDNRTMIVSVFFNTTTVGGTPDTTLQIPIPESRVATKPMSSALNRFLDNNVLTSGLMQVVASGTVIQIFRSDFAALTASTNQTGFRGQLIFEVNP